MKVLYVINGIGTGGSERSLYEMLPGLVARGVEPTIACLYRRQEGVQQAVLDGGYDVRFLHSTRLPGRVREVRGLVRATRADVVHTVHFESDMAGRLAALRTGASVVTSLVNTTYDPARADDPLVNRRRLQLVRAVDGWTGRHLTDHFHAVSHEVKRSAVEHLHLRPERVTVVPRGRDERRLGEPSEARRDAARARLGVSTSDEVLVTVGRQEYQKAHTVLFSAVGELVARGRSVHLFVAGRRGNQSELLDRRLADEPDVAAHVTMLGHVDDVPDLLAAADLFVFPSRYEGLPGAVIEAMALGLPIVASDIAPVREVVQSGENAVLIPPEDASALADAIAGLMDDGERRQKMGAISRQQFEARFTLDIATDGFVAVYRELVTRTGR